MVRTIGGSVVGIAIFGGKAVDQFPGSFRIIWTDESIRSRLTR